MILLLIAAIIAALILGAAYLCYRIVFSVPKKDISDPHLLPEGRQYRLLENVIHPLIDQALSQSYEDVFVQYEDHLQLHGKLYLQSPDAPVQILFHGYRSVAERDFCGGLKLALKAGHNVLLVDQRAHGKSQGKATSFGIKESQDCIAWINYVQQRFGEKTKIILVGISMGAATVLMAAGMQLPRAVAGVIADCGYTSPRDIICRVMRDRQYPVNILYPLIRLGGRVYGGFDINANSAEEAMKRCHVPVLFIHGEADRYVPCSMSRTNYWACASKKTLLTVPGAGHGLSYMIDEAGYKKAVSDFLNSIL